MGEGMRSRIWTNRVRIGDARQSRGPSRTIPSGPTPSAIIDKFTVLPISACIFALIIFPLLIFLHPPTAQAMLTGTDARPEPRIFWPVITAISVLLAVRNPSRLSRLTWPPQIICLLLYLAFAGASVLWSFNPRVSFIRFTQQAMIVTSIVLPALLAAPKADMMRGLFLWCFAPAALLNIPFVFENSPSVVAALKGYPGYFLGKNALGELAAIPFLLAIHEMFYSGWRRALGIVIGAVAVWLLFWANSKTAFGLALVVPFLAGLTLYIRKITRLSPAIILLAIPLCYALLSLVSHSDVMGRISYIIYGDSSLTGRTVIWDFANYEIARRPFVGWGYQSFWLSGPDAPSLVDGPGWVKTMPDAHNGYVDTKLELGYIGLALLLSFIIATLHGVGRMADRDPARAALVLSLALYIIVYNFLESLWMRGFEFLWVVFLIVTAEIARYWRVSPVRAAANGSRSQGSASLRASPSAGAPQSRIGLP